LWFLRRFKTQTGEQWTLLIGEDVSQVKSYEQRLARIYHATPLGIFTADRFGKILDGYSRQLAVMLGRDDLATKQITDVFWNPDQVSVSLDEFDQFLDLIRSLGGPWQGIEKRASSQVSVFRFKIPGTHSAFRWYKMSLKAIEMDGIFAEILVVLEDQTEWIEVQERQKEAERQSRAMYELAVKDSLTGLYNRHFINDGVQSLLSSCARGTLGPVSVVMADIDFFKKINDQYGHAAGDEVLRQVGACIQHQARSNDVPIRFGGEEFMVLITAPCHLAQLFAERLRLAVEKLKFEFQGQNHQVTISLGLAGYRIGESLDALIARADGALYTSKNSGRNRTTVDEEDLIRDTPKD
jgi:diguanylate cyclase (GGDEF)-like protein